MYSTGAACSGTQEGMDFFKGRGDKITRFLDILSPIADRKNDPYLETLAAIATYNIRPTTEFWKEQMLRSPERYAPLCFRQTMKIDAYKAVELLPFIAWTPASTVYMQAVIIHFAALVEQDQTLKEYVQAMMPALDDAAKDFIREIVLEQRKRQREVTSLR